MYLIGSRIPVDPAVNEYLNEIRVIMTGERNAVDLYRTITVLNERGYRANDY